MKLKFYSTLALFALIGQSTYAQVSVQLRTSSGFTPPGQGPSAAAIPAIPLFGRSATSNNFSGDNTQTTVGFYFENQQYTGFNYSNISTGLVFGAQPTQASSSGVQAAGVYNMYNKLGYYPTSPGGPTSDMFKASASINYSNYGPANNLASTGMFSGAATGEKEANGGIFLFTCAQRLFDLGSAYGTNNRYYYGDLVINFNRFVQNPIVHVAGLGGSYRYYTGSGNSNQAANWRSTYFSTELEVVGYTAVKIAGNPNLDIPAGTGQILNSSTQPNGGSVSPTPNDIFNDYGAASGSFRVVGTVKTIRLKVYLRGSDASQFGWSALASASGETVNPVTGDIWAVSVSGDESQLITLPATGMTLTGALNNNNVTLNWKTASEINTKQFEIERSIDGVNYTTIGTKDAAGDSPVESRYSIVDPNMNAQVHYYRIKLTDFDGKVSYSNVIVIRKTGAVKAVKTFPNPVVNAVNLEFSNMKGNYTIELFNKGGQLVHSEKAVIASTVQYVVIQRNSMPAGSYSLRIRNLESGEITTEKIIVQ